MRPHLSLFTPLVLAIAVQASVLKGGGGGGSTGGDDPGGTTTASGIPNVTDSTKPHMRAVVQRARCNHGWPLPRYIPTYLLFMYDEHLYIGRCTDNARASIRLAFHDAGTFSLNLQANALPNGGPDGSILTDPLEVQRPENHGLEKIVSLLQPIVAQFGVSPGDVVQLAGILGVLACPGGPKITFWAGRPAPRNIAPNATRDLMALIGAHTTGKQRFVSVAAANATFDTTVDIWDTRFYTQTQATTTQPGTFKLDSDLYFSTNASTTVEFSRFIGQQNLWIAAYVPAHEAMSVLGLSTSSLTDCSEILPLAIDLTTVEVVSRHW
ncbi:heme peroxidase [Mycena amicta]|nr:heme peroxidase [Mycena amicta]